MTEQDYAIVVGLCLGAYFTGYTASYALYIFRKFANQST